MIFPRMTLEGLALSGACFWDSPSSEMGVIPDGGSEPGGGGAADDGDADKATDTSTQDVDNGQDGDGDGGANARGGRHSGDDGDDGDQDDDPLSALGSDDDDDDSRPADERLRKVVKKNRRLERAVKKTASLVARQKELADQGLTIDDLLHSHRSLSTLQKRLESSPQLRKLIEGGEGEGGSGKGKAEPVKYPFKTDNESGQFFKQLHENVERSTTDFNDRLDRIEAALKEDRQERRVEKTTASIGQWKTAATTAAKQIPEPYRELFMHTIGSDMRRVLEGKMRGTPQTVIDFHLAKLKKTGAIGKATTSRASEAARESIARRNEKQPRTPKGHGAPGPPKERRIQRLADYNRGLRQRFGGN